MSLLGEDIAAEIEMRFLPWLKLAYNFFKKITEKSFSCKEMPKENKKAEMSKSCMSKSP